MLLTPAVALAASDYVYNVSLLPEDLEDGIEFLNLVIAIMAAVFAVKLAALSQGGELEKTWNSIAIVASLFALLEMYGALNGLMLVNVVGLGDLIELFFGVVLLAAVYKTRKFLLKKVMGK